MMSDEGVAVDKPTRRVGQLALGALAVVAAVGLFLWADGYFGAQQDLDAQTSGVLIEGRQ